MHSFGSILLLAFITTTLATPFAHRVPTDQVDAKATPSSSSFHSSTFIVPFGNRPTDFPCLTTDAVSSFVAGFTDLLQNTDVGAKYGLSQPYNYTLAASILDVDFHDYSDSINWLIGDPLTTISNNTATQPVTFASLAAFNAGQSTQYPVRVYTEKTWMSCNFFVWHYVLVTNLGSKKPVSGINVFEVTSDGTKLKTDYAEFNSGLWEQEVQAASAGKS